VLVEHKDGNIQPSTLPVITAAQQISQNVSALVTAGNAVQSVIEQTSKIAHMKKVFVAQHEMLSNPLAEPIAEVLSQLSKENTFSHVLAPSSTFGKNVLPRAAGLLGIEQISDVLKIKDADTFDRPIYAGNAIATVKYTNPGMRLLTVRPTAFDAAAIESKTCPVEVIDKTKLKHLEKWKDKVRWIGEEVGTSDRPDLGSAKIVVSGGRALQSKENFKLVEKLAEQLGAAVGATRAAVDAGYAPNDWQVGQTGKVVAPDLYIALGISGAIQHLAGMTSSKTIVAINTDPDAPIFQVADYGLVQDIFSALPELSKEISALPSRP